MIRVLFLIFLSLIAGYIAGYPLVLSILSSLSNRRESNFDSNAETLPLPLISIIIIAHNEEHIIAKRIENCLSLDYPKDKMEIIVCSDASTDRTIEIAKRYEDQGVRVIQATVQNKTKTREMGIQVAKGKILFFTDADTLYEADCIHKTVHHYADPNVGCVGGELRTRSFKEGALGRGQGLYWRWEYALRRWQSQLGVLTKVSGANMSLRRELYKQLPEDVDIDQMAGPMTIMQGYRVVHEPSAIAYETFPISLSGELSTRIRLTIRALTALSGYKELLNPLKYGWISINEIFYRLFRYLLPFFLIGFFIANALLYNKGTIYNALFIAQILFYSFAVIGYFFEKFQIKNKIFSIPFSLVYFNIGILIGVLKFLKGERLKRYSPEELN